MIKEGKEIVEKIIKHLCNEMKKEDIPKAFQFCYLKREQTILKNYRPTSTLQTFY